MEHFARTNGRHRCQKARAQIADQDAQSQRFEKESRVFGEEFEVRQNGGA
jgi:hypothetical protein